MKYVYTFFFLLMAIGLHAQNSRHFKSMQPDQEFENVLAKKIYSDKHTSTFVIWIKKEVKAHHHQSHTEQVYILEGKGEMILGDQKIMVKKGDWITIPEGMIHSVKVLSKKSLKVVSIQTPEFKGKDRIFVD